MSYTFEIITQGDNVTITLRNHLDNSDNQQSPQSLIDIILSELKDKKQTDNVMLNVQFEGATLDQISFDEIKRLTAFFNDKLYLQKFSAEQFPALHLSGKAIAARNRIIKQYGLQTTNDYWYEVGAFQLNNIAPCEWYGVSSASYFGNGVRAPATDKELANTLFEMGEKGLQNFLHISSEFSNNGIYNTKFIYSVPYLSNPISFLNTLQFFKICNQSYGETQNIFPFKDIALHFDKYEKVKFAEFFEDFCEFLEHNPHLSFIELYVEFEIDEHSFAKFIERINDLKITTTLSLNLGRKNNETLNNIILKNRRSAYVKNSPQQNIILPLAKSHIFIPPQHWKKQIRSLERPKTVFSHTKHVLEQNKTTTVATSAQNFTTTAAQRLQLIQNQQQRQQADEGEISINTFQAGRLFEDHDFKDLNAEESLTKLLSPEILFNLRQRPDVIDDNTIKEWLQDFWTAIRGKKAVFINKITPIALRMAFKHRNAFLNGLNLHNLPEGFFLVTHNGEKILCYEKARKTKRKANALTVKLKDQRNNFYLNGTFEQFCSENDTEEDKKILRLKFTDFEKSYDSPARFEKDKKTLAESFEFLMRKLDPTVANQIQQGNLKDIWSKLSIHNLKVLRKVFLNHGVQGIVDLLSKLEMIRQKDEVLFDAIRAAFIDKYQNLIDLATSDFFSAIDKLYQFNQEQRTWWIELCKQQVEHEGKVDLEDAVSAFEYFQEQLKAINPNFRLPDVCNITGVKNIIVSLDRLFYIIQNAADPMEQFYNMAGVSVGSEDAYYAIAYDKYKFVCSEMELISGKAIDKEPLSYKVDLPKLLVALSLSFAEFQRYFFRYLGQHCYLQPLSIYREIVKGITESSLDNKLKHHALVLYALAGTHERSMLVDPRLKIKDILSLFERVSNINFAEQCLILLANMCRKDEYKPTYDQLTGVVHFITADIKNHDNYKRFIDLFSQKYQGVAMSIFASLGLIKAKIANSEQYENYINNLHQVLVKSPNNLKDNIVLVLSLINFQNENEVKPFIIRLQELFEKSPANFDKILSVLYELDIVSSTDLLHADTFIQFLEKIIHYGKELPNRQELINEIRLLQPCLIFKDNPEGFSPLNIQNEIIQFLDELKKVKISGFCLEPQLDEIKSRVSKCIDVNELIKELNSQINSLVENPLLKIFVNQTLSQYLPQLTSIFHNAIANYSANIHLQAANAANFREVLCKYLGKAKSLENIKNHILKYQTIVKVLYAIQKLNDPNIQNQFVILLTDIIKNDTENTDEQLALSIRVLNKENLTSEQRYKMLNYAASQGFLDIKALDYFDEILGCSSKCFEYLLSAIAKNKHNSSEPFKSELDFLSAVSVYMKKLSPLKEEFLIKILQFLQSKSPHSEFLPILSNFFTKDLSDKKLVFLNNIFELIYENKLNFVKPANYFQALLANLNLAQSEENAASIMMFSQDIIGKNINAIPDWLKDANLIASVKKQSISNVERSISFSKITHYINLVVDLNVNSKLDSAKQNSLNLYSDIVNHIGQHIINDNQLLSDLANIRECFTSNVHFGKLFNSLKTKYGDFFDKNSGNELNQSEQLKLIMLALLREVYYRSQGLWLKDSQLLVLLYTLLSNNHNLSEFPTGEGKSAVCAIQAAALSLQGNTVDICSSSPVLAERDYKSEAKFFTQLNIATCFIQPSSKIDTYKKGGVHYSDVASMALFRQSAELQDSEFLKEAKMALIMDEVDATLLDDTSHYVLAQGLNNDKDTHENPDAWIYPLVNTFFDYLYDRAGAGENFNTLDSDIHAFFSNYDDSQNRFTILEEVNVLKQFLYKNAPPEKRARLNELHIEEQLNVWLDSARTAKHLEGNVNFIIKKVKGEKYSRAVILEKGLPNAKSTWSDGVHQLLHSRLNADLKQNKKFRYEPERKAVSIQTSQAFVQFYAKRGRVLGNTGTIGSVIDIKALNKMPIWNGQGVELIQFPPHAPTKRKHLPTIYAKNESEQVKKVINAIKKHDNQPVLIICGSIEELELLESLLRGKLSRDIQCLDARNAVNEDEINKNASEKNSVILSTLSSRGTDIPINGGKKLLVLNTSIMSKRAERQAYGRTARKGQEGVAGSAINLTSAGFANISKRQAQQKIPEIQLQIDKQIKQSRAQLHLPQSVIDSFTIKIMGYQPPKDIESAKLKEFIKIKSDALDKLKKKLADLRNISIPNINEPTLKQRLNFIMPLFREFEEQLWEQVEVKFNVAEFFERDSAGNKAHKNQQQINKDINSDTKQNNILESDCQKLLEFLKINNYKAMRHHLEKIKKQINEVIKKDPERVVNADLLVLRQNFKLFGNSSMLDLMAKNYAKMPLVATDRKVAMNDIQTKLFNNALQGNEDVLNAYAEINTAIYNSLNADQIENQNSKLFKRGGKSRFRNMLRETKIWLIHLTDKNDLTDLIKNELQHLEAYLTLELKQPLYTKNAQFKALVTTLQNQINAENKDQASQLRQLLNLSSQLNHMKKHSAFSSSSHSLDNIAQTLELLVDRSLLSMPEEEKKPYKFMLKMMASLNHLDEKVFKPSFFKKSNANFINNISNNSLFNDAFNDIPKNEQYKLAKALQIIYAGAENGSTKGSLKKFGAVPKFTKDSEDGNSIHIEFSVSVNNKKILCNYRINISGKNPIIYIEEFRKLDNDNQLLPMNARL